MVHPVIRRVEAGERSRGARVAVEFGGCTGLYRFHIKVMMVTFSPSHPELTTVAGVPLTGDAGGLAGPRGASRRTRRIPTPSRARDGLGPGARTSRRAPLCAGARI